MSADLLEAFGGPSIVQTDRGGRTLGQKQASNQINPSLPVQKLKQSLDAPEEQLWRSGGNGNDVLFDAAEEQGGNDFDDDFGDFEDVMQDGGAETRLGELSISSQPSKDPSPVALVDLLGLEETAGEAIPVPHAPDSVDAPNPVYSHNSIQIDNEPTAAADDGWGDFEAAPPATHKIKATSSPGLSHDPVAPGPEDGIDNAWDDFEDGEAAKPVPQLPPKQQTVSKLVMPNSKAAAPSQSRQHVEYEDEDWASFEDRPMLSTPTASVPPGASSIPSDATRPTNVPPPSVLFSWLTSIYSNLSPTPLAAAPVFTLHRLTARILAGRSRRWQRDTLLSQSLRISDTTSGSKHGGMKLSSLSKSEKQREAREATETLSAWNALVPSFTTSLRKQDVKVPVGIRLKLSEPLAVKLLKSGEGGLDATYICPVCGLKRNERVVGVDDVGVEDVFGEFWREGWGHQDCAEGWYTHKSLLGQR